METNKPDSPCYLAVKHQHKPDDDVWYMRSPLGKNEIGKSLSAAAKNAGLQGRVNNQSVRKSCISHILNADVPDNFVAQLSGRRSLKSQRLQIGSYEHQRWMSLALSRLSPNRPASISTRRETTTHPTAFVTSVESAMFNPVEMGSGFPHEQRLEVLCTFNIQLTSGQLCTTERAKRQFFKAPKGRQKQRPDEMNSLALMVQHSLELKC